MSRFQGFRYLARMVWAADRRSVVTILSFLPANAASLVVMSWAFKQAVDSVVDDGNGAVPALIVGSLAVGVLATFGLWQGNLERLVADKVSMQLDRDLLETLDSIPGIEHLESPDHLDRVELVLDKGRDLSAALWAATDVAATLLRLIVTAALLATVHPLLVLLPLAAVPVIVATGRAQPIVFAAEKEIASDQRMRDALHDLSLEQTAAMELKLYGGAEEISSRSQHLGLQVDRKRLQAEARAAAVLSLGWLCFAAAFGAAMWITARGVTDGSATIGDLVLVWQLSVAALWAMRRLMWRTQNIQRSLEVLDRYLSIRGYADAQRSAWVDDRQQPAADVLSDGVELRRVSFIYPGTEAPVLEDVSITLEAGTTVALVGENGAGKSTLIKLLLGHYRPTTGEILVDGRPMDRLDPQTWRARTSATYQDYSRIEALVRQSVGVGDVGRIDDDDALATAIDRAAADGVVAPWRRGLDTPLGKTYHDGVQPSGGQWQRLAIARSFLPAAPLLFVFDEPTSALDPLHEAELLHAYAAEAEAARARGGITLMISHRFSTVRSADQIVVIDGGHIVESGTHDELTTAGGRYAELYELQSTAYR